jgi:hypothetical protein
MSFKCHDHGWTHLLKSCPACSPQTMSSNSLVISPDPKDQRISELESKLAHAEEVISYYAKDGAHTFHGTDHEDVSKVFFSNGYMVASGKRAREYLERYGK